jgi:signal transduction histidine kinase
VETDPNKFQQIVFNFLSNAVKFTPEGGQVTLRGERYVGSDAQGRVRIAVIDSGPGIPASKQRVIFEKFVQLDTGHTKSAQGTGLGLAIAKEFAEMIGGEIELVSEVGRGSVFSLIVPLEAAGDVRRRAEAGHERDPLQRA